LIVSVVLFSACPEFYQMVTVVTVVTVMTVVTVVTVMTVVTVITVMTVMTVVTVVTVITVMTVVTVVTVVTVEEPRKKQIDSKSEFGEKKRFYRILIFLSRRRASWRLSEEIDEM
jgi:ABC-type multidrug transport system fused ATPase/permease subunit